MWVQLGGHCEPGDHTLLDAAAREAREESGIGALSFDPVPLGLRRAPDHLLARRADTALRRAVPRASRRRAPTPVRSDESLDLRWFGVGRAARRRVARASPRMVEAAAPRLAPRAGLRRHSRQVDELAGAAAAAAVVGPAGVLAARGPVDEPFPLASVTKPLAALAMLVAVEEEAVELDDPADERLDPRRHAAPPARPRLRAARRSGRMRAAAPATRRIYSNVGIELRGRAGRGGDRDAVRRLLRPRRCAPAADGRRPRCPARRPRDGVSIGAPTWPGWSHEVCSPHRAAAPRRRWPTRRTVQYPGLRGVLPGFGAQDPNDWGLGFEIRGHKSAALDRRAATRPRTFGHFGQSGTMLWIDPAAGIGLVALTDRDFGPWAAAAWPRAVRRRPRRRLTCLPLLAFHLGCGCVVVAWDRQRRGGSAARTCRRVRLCADRAAAGRVPVRFGRRCPRRLRRGTAVQHCRAGVRFTV